MILNRGFTHDEFSLGANAVGGNRGIVAVGY